MKIGTHLATLNLWREADGKVYITIAEANGAVREQKRTTQAAVLPIEYIEGLIHEAATTTLGRKEGK